MESGLLLHTIRPRLIPASRALSTTIPGQSFPIRAAETLAIIFTGSEKANRAITTAFLNDHLVLGGFEGFAVGS
jgi:hypothetical protein